MFPYSVRNCKIMFCWLFFFSTHFFLTLNVTQFGQKHIFNLKVIIHDMLSLGCSYLLIHI